ncbi:snRNA-activating protein complex subunit 2 [Takifugu rubripes]|uniref:snRNA-activating protein complex subunit 2 n=1 Tax=Takifugu rubripes TaxID=31033 RepID=UPI001145BADF|nr:snRNA-activating protein complex subunit 2 [Takifugu rubripes]
MKPPPRKRAKVDRSLEERLGSRNLLSKWQQPEKKKLLKALRILGKTTGGNVDIDYAFLQKSIVTRSVSEIECVVESLKDKVISGALQELSKWKSQRNLRKPIEIWKDMAFSVTGNLEEHISTAFSQMLMVSSTEPCTLANSDPPHVHKPPKTTHLVGRTVPLRPVPHAPFSAQPVNSGGRLRPATPPTSQSAAPSPAAEKSPRSPSATTQSVDSSTVQQPSAHHQTAAATPASSSPGPGTAPPPATSATPVSSVSPTPATCNPATVLSPSAAAAHARFGRTSKYATTDSPRMLGVKCVVDFEKIYRYLSMIHKPDWECHLTAMESAIVLDLLMSLPEELPHLDCDKLYKHLLQVYKCLSSPAHSSNAKEMLEALRRTFAGQTETETGTGSGPAGNETAGQQDTAAAADLGDVAAGGGQKTQPNESSRTQNTPKQSSNADVTEFSPPPLNPFMIPLEMLRRK